MNGNQLVIASGSSSSDRGAALRKLNCGVNLFRSKKCKCTVSQASRYHPYAAAFRLVSPIFRVNGCCLFLLYVFGSDILPLSLSTC